MTDKLTLKITIESPHGTQPLSQFRHFLGKVADESKARWGIDIEITEQADEPDYKGGFE